VLAIYVYRFAIGTPVGDPIEYESIRQTFTDQKRVEDLYLGSVKDNIGHAEAASGAAGLLKTLLMLQNRTIPKQANFSSLNPKIVTSSQDRISVPRQNHPWEVRRQVAVVNNYGAAGSNAAIVVEGNYVSSLPLTELTEQNGTATHALDSSYPFIIKARYPENLRSYCAALESFISRQLPTKDLLSSLAYNMTRKHNRTFEYVWSSTASSITDIRNQLKNSAAGNGIISQQSHRNRPVVLCFGGQNGSTVTLSEGLFQSSRLLRIHIVR